MTLCWVCIQQGEVGMEERLGRFTRAIPSGCHSYNCLLKSIKGRMSLRSFCSTGTLRAPTRDQAEVTLTVCTIYRVIPEQCEIAFYRLQNPSAQIKSFIEATLRPMIRNKKLDELFSDRNSLETALVAELTPTMRSFGYEITNVLIPSMTPVGQVRNAMNQQCINRYAREVSRHNASIENIHKISAANANIEVDRLRGVGVAEARRILSTAFHMNQADDSVLSESDVITMILLIQYFDFIAVLESQRTFYIPSTGGRSKSPQALTDVNI